MLVDARAEDVARLQAAVASLGAEARLQSAIVDRMLARERRRAAAAREIARQGDALEQIRRQADRAAYVTLRQAEMLLHEADDAAGAAACYQQVIDMFPETFWARLARQRRDTLREGRGDSL